MRAPFLFFTLLESSEREKNKIKSGFGKVFPVAPVATFGAFFWGEKKDLARDDAKVGATNVEEAARGGGLGRLRGLQGGGGEKRERRRWNEGNEAGV